MSGNKPKRELRQKIELSDEQRLNWLRLIRCENVGPATFRDLVNHFHSAATALEALPDLIAHGTGAKRIRICSRAQAEQEMEAADRAGARFIASGEPGYPTALRAIDAPPPLICVKGDQSALEKRAIAIVGSRNASINGMRLAGRFASELGQAGFSIVSGLARGIDASAHRHSLSTGTVAVFAGGVDKVFPDENRELATQILNNGGCFLSEMPMGWAPRAKDFPRRNRLVAGIAHGLLVVEAAKRSGSLISARLATEAGRTVYAIPGSPLDPRSAGTNWLIKQGATLVTDAEDIVSDLEGIAFNPETGFEMEDTHESDIIPPEAAANMRDAIIEAMGPSPVEVDDIIRLSGATAGQVQLILIELDLCGKLERHGGGRVSLCFFEDQDKDMIATPE